jgi:hypothetical protein
MMERNQGTEVPIALRVVAQRTRELETEKLLAMDFPTLDELEMDVPILNSHMGQARLAPEDDENLEMQYMLHFDPTIQHTLGRY